MGQLNTHGIKSTMLLAADGRLMCYTSSPDFLESDRMIGSVASHSFAEYSAAAKTGFEAAADVDLLFLEMELGNVAVMPLTDAFLLCCYSDTTADLAHLKARMTTARRGLAESLGKVGVLNNATATSS